METELLASALRDTEAALGGLADTLQGGEVPAALLPIPLARVGDALRLRLAVPGPVGRWADGLSQQDLQGALGSLIDEASSWRLPGGESPSAEGDPILAFALRRRDETESVRHAVRRICLPKGLDPYELTEFAALDSVLALLDVNMSAILSRADVVRLLGTRAAMQPTWADGFRDAPIERAEHRAGSDDRWPEAIRHIVPSDEVVTRYVTRGALSRYVEGVAAANEAFVQDLAACIDAVLAAREDVGLVARRWRKRAPVKATTDPLRLAVVPLVRLAAATSTESAIAKTVLRLGELAPTDAEGRLEVTSRDVTVHIYPGEKVIQRVELGSAVATAPNDSGSWILVAPLPEASLRLRVIAADGSEFAEDLHFAPIDASDEAR